MRSPSITARSHPEQPDFASPAERVVWQALVDALPDDAHVMAGLRYSDARGDGEADLVVAWPGVGVATIEVKGGHVHRRDGGWRQSDRGESRDVDPVGQASRAKYAVFDLFASRHSERLRAEHLVAFPHWESWPTTRRPTAPAGGCSTATTSNVWPSGSRPRSPVRGRHAATRTGHGRATGRGPRRAAR